MRMLEETIPDSATVMLFNCSTGVIDSLPAEMRVAGNLDVLFSAGATALPRDLRVSGNIYLAYSKGLTETGDVLVSGGQMDFTGCPITKLPEETVCLGSLNVQSCESLTGLPENLVVDYRIFYNEATMFYRSGEFDEINERFAEKLQKSQS